MRANKPANITGFFQLFACFMIDHYVGGKHFVTRPLHIEAPGRLAGLPESGVLAELFRGFQAVCVDPEIVLC